MEEQILVSEIGAKLLEGWMLVGTGKEGRDEKDGVLEVGRMAGLGVAFENTGA